MNRISMTFGGLDLAQELFDGEHEDADRQAQSELELLVTQMLSRERIPEGKLFEICEQAYGWEPVERFYYTPILLVLIQYAVRSL